MESELWSRLGFACERRRTVRAVSAVWPPSSFIVVDVQVTDYLQGVVTRVQCLAGGDWQEEPVIVTSTVYAHRSVIITLCAI